MLCIYTFTNDKNETQNILTNGEIVDRIDVSLLNVNF